MAEESAAAMVEMDRAIQEVGEHVREASGLTEQVSHGAEAGQQAVTATIDGIEEIRAQTSRAKTVLERLAERIGEIGEIVNVIGAINDETNLLSLNAAIIAAQAGEQGKAFAVVANHVKTLAQRTAGSTKEIEGLIRAVQDESSNAVRAMAAGMEAVESGVQRSRKAGEELDRIRASSREASSRVAEIARAAGEQGRNSKHVAEAAQNTSSMVQQISTAMSEQSRASDAMLKNAEAALELCRQVHRSTEEQRESGRFITASIGSITEMIRSIQQNTESHSAASEAVSDAVGRILDVARKSGERVPEVLRAVEELREHAGALADAAGTGSARAAGFLS
jgi:methyl-accepting chemotaxis protein